MIQRTRIDMVFLKLLCFIGLIFEGTVVTSANLNRNLPESLHFRSLGERVKPLRYDVVLYLNPSLLQFDVDSNISFELILPSKVILIHAHKLEINFRQITLIKYGKNIQENMMHNVIYRPVDIAYHKEAEIVAIYFNSILVLGTYAMNIKARGVINNTEGFSLTFINYDQKISYFLATDLFPFGARQLFPCWDEPALKAIFKISIYYDENYNFFISGMKNLTISKNSNGLRESTESPPISTYLLAIVISDFDVVSETDFKNIRMWCRSTVANQVTFAKSIGEMVLKNIIDNYMDFVIEPEINIFVLPVKYNLTQGWGAIIISEHDIVCGYNDTEDRKLQVAHTVARQIIYQCFGNLVSPSWWSHAWFNEAIATFLQYLILDSLNSYWQVMDNFVVEFQQVALRKVKDSHLEHFTLYYNKIDVFLSLFSSPTYNKAPFIIRMLYHTVTEDVFADAMKVYISNNKFNSSTPKQFWALLQDSFDYMTELFHPCTIKEFVDSWLTQKGYPVLYVERDHNLNSTMLIQIPSNGKNATHKGWWIPITFTTQSILDFVNTWNCVWMKPNEKLDISDIFEFDSDEWIIFNLQQTGYYRVNYDPIYWERIAKYLNSDKYNMIHVLNRAQIIDDSYYFLLKNQLNPSSVFFELINYLKRETNYTPWYPMKRIFQNLWRYYQYPEGAHIGAHVLKLMNGLLDNVINVEMRSAVDKESPKILFAMEWACNFGHEECKIIASKKLQDYIALNEMKNRRNEISSSWKKWICMGLMKGNVSTWNKIFQEYVLTKDELAKEEFLQYLTCTEDLTTILYYLQNLVTMQNSKQLENGSFQRAYKFIARKYARNKVVLYQLIFSLTKIKYGTLNPEDLLKPIFKNIFDPTQFDKIKNYLKYMVNIKNSIVDKMIDGQRKRITDEVNKFRKLFSIDRWSIIDK